jgi:uncharacterized protein
MSSTLEAPRMRELDLADIRSILTRNHVGRIAFAWGGSIDIRPIHYACAGDRIYGRTSYGDKFERMRESFPAPVAFEVDEVISFREWRSVIVHGDFAIVVPDAEGREEWRLGVEMLRRVTRATFRDHDPFPERDLVFAITMRQLSGRAMQ